MTLSRVVYDEVVAGPGVDMGALTMKVREGGRVIKIAVMVARGLNGVALVTSDAHAGMVDAIGTNLSGASWQR